MSKLKYSVLGKRLLKYYGCIVGDKRAWLPLEWAGVSTAFVIHSWKSLLFGSNQWFSFNEIVERSFPKVKDKLIMFSSLEELDIQLTLLGANHD